VKVFLQQNMNVLKIYKISSLCWWCGSSQLRDV